MKERTGKKIKKVIEQELKTLNKSFKPMTKVAKESRKIYTIIINIKMQGGKIDKRNYCQP